jgi:phosphoglycolate phosphatase
MAFGMQDNQLDPAGLMAVGSRHENEIAAAAYIAETGRSWFESLAIARSSFNDADQYCQPDMNSSPMFAGSLDVIQTLSDVGLKLAILSAASTPSVERFVKDHQLSPYLSLLMGAEQGLTKPNPVFFLKACEALGVNPEATLMVGDSQGDMEMSKKAKAAGAIGIYWGKGPKTHLQKADVIINHLDQIQVEI